jgi:hypothetical protein
MRILRQKLCSTLVVTILSSVALLAGPVASSSAYEGPFCSNVKLKALGGWCQSNKVSNVRRAGGRSEGGYTLVAIYGVSGEKRQASCETAGCEVGTGYLSYKQEGRGLIENIGLHEHKYYGWLYP